MENGISPGERKEKIQREIAAAQQMLLHDRTEQLARFIGELVDSGALYIFDRDSGASFEGSQIQISLNGPFVQLNIGSIDPCPSCARDVIDTVGSWQRCSVCEERVCSECQIPMLDGNGKESGYLCQRCADRLTE